MRDLEFDLLFFKIVVQKFCRICAEQCTTHDKNKYWEIYMTECSTFRYVRKLLKTRSTVPLKLDQ